MNSSLRCLATGFSAADLCLACKTTKPPAAPDTKLLLLILFKPASHGILPSSATRTHTIGKKTFKVHLDGYNLLPHLTGKEPNSPRKFFIYFTDDGDVAALRYDNWKMLFMEQRVPGTLKIWQEPFVTLRTPYIFNLRMDPYGRAQITSNAFYDWMFHHIFLLVPAQALVAEFLSTFKEFPPRQKAASFSLDQVIEKMTAASAGA